MFKLIPQFIVIVAVLTVIIIALRRLPQVTVPEEEEPQSLSRSGRTGDSGFAGLLRRLNAFIARSIRSVANFVVEAKGLTVSSQYLKKLTRAFQFRRAHRMEESKVRKTDSVEARAEVPTSAPSRAGTENAEQEFIKIIESDPSNRAAYEGLGKLYVDNAKHSDALEVYTYLTRIYPTEDNYWSKLGLVNFNLGDYPAAVSAYERAVQLRPDASHRLINLSLCYEAQGDLAQAITAVRSALAIAPSNVSYLILLSDFLTRELKRGEAQEVLEQVLELEPTNQVAREKLMRLKF